MHTSSRMARMRLGRRIMKSLFGVLLSLPLMITVYIASFFVVGGLYALAEGDTFGKGLWWAVATTPGVGHAEVYPESFGGKIIAGFYANFRMLVVFPIIIGHVVVKVFKNAHIFTHAEQEWLMNLVGKIAAKLGINVPPQPYDTNYDKELINDN